MKMKNQIILSLLSVTLFASCNNSQKQNNQTTDITDTKDTIDNTDKINEFDDCYAYSKDSSNVMMHLIRNGNLVTGELVYDYFEKDKNTGTIKGEMKGDTLFAEYIFMSEGINSVREVAFLQKGDDLIEGYGDVEEQTAKIVFKNKAALKFESNITLKKTDCNKR